MSQFTQLNLQARDPKGSSSANPPTRTNSREKTVFYGSLAVVSLLGAVLLGINGCSKSSTHPGVSASPNPQPAIASVAPASPSASVAPATSPQPAPKRPKRKRPATVTYTDRTYGVSFQYPRKYILKTGDEVLLDVAGLGPAQTNFVQAGGVTLAAVELPRNAYPGADSSSAFFNVSVNPNLTAAECSQFASPQPKDTEPSSVPSKVKVGSIEFDETEGAMKQADSKYYHVFQNGACYEFALGVGTTGDEGDVKVTQVDRQQVFDRLEKILATVKIQTVEVPATEGPVQTEAPAEKAAPSETPVPSSATRF